MKKHHYMLTSILVTLILIMGCSPGNNKSVSTKNQTKNTTQALKSDFLIGKGKLNTKDSQEWEKTYSNQVGVFRKDFGEYIGYLIGQGKKPTGGYFIDIKIKEKDNKVSIIYEEKIPPKGSFNTQVITNNYNVVYLKKEKSQVEINENQAGKLITIANITQTK